MQHHGIPTADNHVVAKKQKIVNVPDGLAGEPNIKLIIDIGIDGVIKLKVKDGDVIHDHPMRIEDYNAT